MASAEPICHIVTPVSNLGYGFDNIGVNNLLRQLTASAIPTGIILNSQFSSQSDENRSEAQAGQRVNVPAGHRASCLRDLRRLLRCVGTHGVPLILNTVSTTEAGYHLQVVAGMVEEAQRENSQDLRTVVVDDHHEQQQHSSRTMGTFVQKLLAKAEAEPNFEVLLTSSDSRLAPFTGFASLCLKNRQAILIESQVQAASVRGTVLHLAKILEEGGVSAMPRCAGAAGTLFSDGSLEVTPVGSRSQCSSISLASYILQPKSRLSVPEVGGALDLRQASYQTLEDNRFVRVRGSTLRRVAESERWFEAQAFAERPYRSLYVGRITDAHLAASINDILHQIKGYVQAQQLQFPANSWDLSFQVFGRDTGEIVVAGEITATSHDIARAMTQIARMATRLATGLQNRGAEFPDAPINVLSLVDPS